MIDVNREISKYHPIYMNKKEVEDSAGHAIGMILKTVTDEIQKFEKRQFMTVQKIEEIFAIIEDEKELTGALRECKKMLQTVEEEKQCIIQGVITLGDALEDIYRYALRTEEESWKQQLEVVWGKTGERLSLFGISRIEGKGQMFMPEFQVAQKVENHPDLPHGQVIDVLRAGYLYRGVLIRKAEVVVNNNLQGSV